MMRIIKRCIYYSCENKKYYTNRLFKKVCNHCLNININNLNKCVYCDNDLNDKNIRLVKNDMYTDIINVRRLHKYEESPKSVKNIEKMKDDENSSFLLMDNIQIDNKYVYLRKGEINKCKKLFAYYSCYDYIILNNPYSVASINLIILFKGIIYDMKNLKRKHISSLLHMYNYVNCIIDIFLFYLLIGKGKTVHYKYMSLNSDNNKKKISDFNEKIIEIVSRLNNVVNERKRNITIFHSKDETERVTKKHNANGYAEVQDEGHVNEHNIIEKINQNYENIYNDIFKKSKDPILSEFSKNIENENIKNTIHILKKYLYIGCSYPSALNHFSIQVLFPPFSNFNFFTFPYYYSIQKILHDLYLYGHVKNYSKADIIKNLYKDTLMRQLKQSDLHVRELLQF